MSKRIVVFLFLFLILGSLSILFYRTSITDNPKGMHAWSQSDRYSLALNFQKNGYDFFHPETYCLNPQFPAEHELKKESGITRVDFPVHDYAVSILMAIFDSREPVVFRLYILFYSLLGLLFLFSLSKNLTGSVMNSLFVVVFAFTAPGFTYYQNGFLPTIPSVANIFIALWFYLHFRNTGKLPYFMISVLFFTLAALARTPFVIFTVALFCVHILGYFRRKKLLWKEIIIFAISFLFIAGYFLYNIYLGKHYGSVFLSGLLPPSGWEETISLLKEIKKNWLFDYFTGWHYLFMVIIFVFALASMIVKKSFFSVASWAWQFLLIAFAGTLIYFVFMLNQFKAHDYYFLDSFFPLIILMLVLLFMKLPTAKKWTGFLTMIVLAFFSAAFVFRAYDIQKDRYVSDPYNFVDAATADFQGSAKFLDAAGVPADARIVVLNSYSYNIALNMMDRKGYTLFNADKGDFQKILQKKWEYAVVQEKMPLSDLLKKDPSLLCNLRRIGGNGCIALYHRENLPGGQTIADFLGLRNAAYSDTISFESDSTNKEKPYTAFITNSMAKTGNNSARILPENEFVEILNSPVGKLNKASSKRILVTGYVKLLDWEPDHTGDLALTLNNSREAYLYSPFKLGDYFDLQNKEWQFFAFQFSLPANHPEDLMKIYFWNNGKNDFLIDDLTITLAAN